LDAAVTKELLILIKKSVFAAEEQIHEDVSLEQLYALSKKHKVANIIYPVLRERIKDTDFEKCFSQAYYKAMYRESIQENEYNAIEGKLLEKNIDFLPLKGIVMKNLYPSSDMRTMIDIDILIKKEDLAKISEIMTGLGYGKPEKGVDHFAYYKEPIMNVEMHFTLISEAKRNGRFSYFSDWWSKAVREEAHNCKWRLQKEDFFIYMLAHCAKHFMGGGCGIRSVLDVYLYEKKVDFNKEYVRSKLKECELLDFYDHLMKLAAIWFENDESNSFYETMTEFIVDGGYQGNTKNRALYEVAATKEENFKKRKFKGAVRKLFPPLKIMKYGYDFLNKYPFLLPAAWIMRCFSALFKKQSYKLLKSSLKVEKEDVKMLEDLYKNLGLLK